MRTVTLVMMKRKWIRPWRLDYGHWWFEVGESLDPASESYGWWPQPLPKNVFRKIMVTFWGTTGELNGQTGYEYGTATRDPYHGQSADWAFNPVVADDDPRSDAEIAECLRQFARSNAGSWRWTFGRGQNCHSFQRTAMDHCRLGEP